MKTLMFIIAWSIIGLIAVNLFLPTPQNYIPNKAKLLDVTFPPNGYIRYVEAHFWRDGYLEMSNGNEWIRIEK